MRSFLLTASLFACLSAANTEAARFYRIEDLSGGYNETFVRAVSGDGTTVVGQSISENGPEAFRWTLEGGLVGLGDFSGGSFASDARDVSYDGNVVVGSGTISVSMLYGPVDSTSAFRWEAGSMASLAGGGSSAEAISADGKVIAGTTQAGSVRWTSNEIALIGPRMDGRVFAPIEGMSADGSIIVGSGQNFSGFSPEAMRWENQGGPQGMLTGLSGLSGSNGSKALAVSPDGLTIVGQSGADAVAFYPPRSLGQLPGGENYSAAALSTSGDGSVIVGETNVTGVGTVAFIWREATGMLRLDRYLESLGADLKGLRLGSATDISDNGFVIVGTGRNSSGETVGWVVIIPEPSTLAMVAVLLVLMACTSRPR